MWRGAFHAIPRSVLGLFALVAAFAGAAGCAPRESDSGFTDVQRTISERVGQRVHWNRGTPADRAVERRIEAIVAQEMTAEDAVAVALLGNPNLQAAYEDLGVSQADLVQAGL